MFFQVLTLSGVAVSLYVLIQHGHILELSFLCLSRDALMEDFLTSLKEVQDANQAMELVQLSASYCLPVTPKLIERVQQEFKLTEDDK